MLGPVATRLGGVNRLAVVAGGALSYLPFAALPMPSAVPGRTPGERLVDRHEVVHLPSASILGNPPATSPTAGRASTPTALTVLAEGAVVTAGESRCGYARRRGLQTTPSKPAGARP